MRNINRITTTCASREIPGSPAKRVASLQESSSGDNDSDEATSLVGSAGTSGWDRDVARWGGVWRPSGASAGRGDWVAVWARPCWGVVWRWGRSGGGWHPGGWRWWEAAVDWCSLDGRGWGRVGGLVGGGIWWRDLGGRTGGGASGGRLSWGADGGEGADTGGWGAVAVVPIPVGLVQIGGAGVVDALADSVVAAERGLGLNVILGEAHLPAVTSSGGGWRRAGGADSAGARGDWVSLAGRDSAGGRSRAERVVPRPVGLVLLGAAGVVDAAVDLLVAAKLLLRGDAGLAEAVVPARRSGGGGAGYRAG